MTVTAAADASKLGPTPVDPFFAQGAAKAIVGLPANIGEPLVEAELALGFAVQQRTAEDDAKSPEGSVESGEEACLVIAGIAEKAGKASAPYVVPLLSALLVKAGDKKNANLRDKAARAARAVLHTVNEYVAEEVCEQILETLQHHTGDLQPAAKADAKAASANKKANAKEAKKEEKESHDHHARSHRRKHHNPHHRHRSHHKNSGQPADWRTKVLCLELLADLAEIAPLQVERSMVRIVPIVSTLMHETKGQVASAAKLAIERCCHAIDNIDLKPFVPQLVRAILDPQESEDCVHALASTTFVQAVYAGALAITVPVLERGFRDRKTAVKRKAAVITENMAKLVASPADVAPFMPVLEPLLQRSKEEVSDPECRARCAAAHDALLGIGSAAQDYIAKHTAQDAAVFRDAHKACQEVLHAVAQKACGGASERADQVVAYATTVVAGLRLANELENEREWIDELGPCLGSIASAKECETLTRKLLEATKSQIQEGAAAAAKGDSLEVCEEENVHDKDLLCDCTFSLAYGSKILLNSARLRLHRGRRYGIVAPRAAGKSTLLRAISNNQVEGFPTPEQCRTIFVEDDIQGSASAMSVVDFVLEKLEEQGTTREEAEKGLEGVGFDAEMRAKPISSLSGGWRIKTALARAMLTKPDIMLFDDPSNHLDVLNVQWLIDYLTGPACKHVTSLIVSNDTHFLDSVATDIIHFNSGLKLDKYLGALNKFVERFPEAKSYYELGNTSIVFKFPQPAPLEGVKAKGKVVMQMQNVSFTYPGAPRPQLNNVNIRVSLASRVACVGANGAGKSTMIKLLTGELTPSTGNVMKHPMLRFAYVAQHAFHHIQLHLNKTPNEYIRWRYEDGSDKEALRKETVQISDAERAIMEKPWEFVVTDEAGKQKREKRVFDRIIGRRRDGKKLMYEVTWKSMPSDKNEWISGEDLEERGFKKLVQEMDRRKLAEESAYARVATQRNVEEHLANVGLDAELANHTRIAELSAGEKVKVVLGAALWHLPQVLILDEPTNFLNRESLGALANALNEFEGGIVLITHHKEFANKVTRETWVVANNRCDVHGDPDWEAYAKEAIELGLDQMADQLDAAGNKLEQKKKRTPDSVKPRDKKKMMKEIKDKIASGAEMTDFEEECATAWGLWAA